MTYPKAVEFWINKDIRRRVYDLTMFTVSKKGEPVRAARPPVMVEVQEGEIIDQPTMALSFEEAEALMTELWRAGVRPVEVGTTGELAAIKYHLEDMRRLVFTEVKE